MRSRTIATSSRYIVLLLAFTFIVPFTACASGPSPSPMDHPEGHPPPKSVLGIWRNPELVSSLGLSKAQVAEIRAEDFSLRERMLAVRSELDAAFLKLDQALTEPSVDRDGVLELATRVKRLEDSLFLEEFSSRLKIASLFNADQARQLGLYDFRPGRMPVKKPKAKSFGGPFGEEMHRKTVSDH